jgi:hypothetical protein
MLVGVIMIAWKTEVTSTSDSVGAIGCDFEFVVAMIGGSPPWSFVLLVPNNGRSRDVTMKVRFIFRRIRIALYCYCGYYGRGGGGGCARNGRGGFGSVLLLLVGASDD